MTYNLDLACKILIHFRYPTVELNKWMALEPHELPSELDHKGTSRANIPRPYGAHALIHKLDGQYRNNNQPRRGGKADETY